ncbi:20S proteasome subunit A/B [Haladaptatus sp. NG-SE-30]
MATILGVACPDGAVLAGDRRETKGGSITSESVQRVFDYDDAGAGVVGDVGAIQEFDRRFESELRTYRDEEDEPMSLDRVARTASEITEDVGVDALVVATDSDGTVGLREVGSDGRVLSTETAALGSGAPIAFGRLEEADTNRELDAVERLARETLAVVAERTPDTGSDLDVLRFEHETGSTSSLS